jgi:ketosteroid isomerase-like protein
MPTETTTTPNVEIVERFLASFDHRWPGEEELRELLTEDVCFVERPNLVNPSGSTRDAAAMRSGLEAGRTLLAWQAYRVLGHVAAGDTVVIRLRWAGELAVDAGPWPAGTHLAAWCVAHYRLREGRIASIEQHDCYEQPVRKGAG